MIMMVPPIDEDFSQTHSSGSKRNLIYTYIPWSKQGKKRSITTARYQNKQRPGTAAISAQKFNATHV
jgi:hypothetical protein